MVGQSFDIVVLARIIAPSTAEVTALMWSGDPLAGVCADAPPSDSVMPRPKASAAPATRLNLPDCKGLSAKDVKAKGRQAEATCGERIISVPSQVISDGSVSRSYASGKHGVNQTRDAKPKRENSCRPHFAKRNAGGIPDAVQHQRAPQNPR